MNLAILGEGPHLPALMERAARLGVADRVKVFGWGPPELVARFINALDSLVLLTRTTPDVREQFGRVIVEAQSCGVPVIGSTSGAIPNVVGRGGWIVPERDPDALAALLTNLARDPARMTYAQNAGLQQVASRFTFERIAETLANSWRLAHNLRCSFETEHRLRPASAHSEITMEQAPIPTARGQAK